MAQTENNFDEILAILFPDNDFSNVFNDFHMSHNVDIEDDGQHEPPLSWLFDHNDQTDTETTVVDGPTELTHLATDAQVDNIAIIDEQSLAQTTTADPNPEVTNLPIPQEAPGNEGGIMYQMDLALLHFITGAMVVIQQPKANNRSRYVSDGKRFLPDSRYHPMSIQLPDLRSISLVGNQQLGIVITMVTSAINPMNKTLLHANDILYREPGAIKIGHGCVFVPMKLSEIDSFQKKFSRLSIIYKKYEEYAFNLTPFDVNTMFGQTERYTVPNETNVDRVPKGKLFKKEYNLLSYKLVFQLAVKQDNVVFISNITCESDVINEQTPPRQPRKRSASVLTEHLSEDEDEDRGEDSGDSQFSDVTKKFKPLASPSIGLPVTRVSNRDGETVSDHRNDDSC